jgi:hypothetical protein
MGTVQYEELCLLQLSYVFPQWNKSLASVDIANLRALVPQSM